MRLNFAFLGNWPTQATAADVRDARQFYRGVRVNWARAVTQGEEKMAALQAQYDAAWQKRLDAFHRQDAAQLRPGSSFDAGEKHRRVAMRWDKKAERLAVELIKERAFLTLAHEKLKAQQRRKARKPRKPRGQLW